MRSIVGVLIRPPKVLVWAAPTSSRRTTRMLGASLGRRRGSTRCLYTESCIVRPATLADGVGGNGKIAPSTAGDGVSGDFARASWAAVSVIGPVPASQPSMPAAAASATAVRYLCFHMLLLRG